MLARLRQPPRHRGDGRRHRRRARLHLALHLADLRGLGVHRTHVRDPGDHRHRCLLARRRARGHCRAAAAREGAALPRSRRGCRNGGRRRALPDDRWRVNPPVPMLAQAIITSVVTTFFLTIVWGGWPWDAGTFQPLVAGPGCSCRPTSSTSSCSSCSFDYGFASGAPFYKASLDPGRPLQRLGRDGRRGDGARGDVPVPPPGPVAADSVRPRSCASRCSGSCGPSPAWSSAGRCSGSDRGFGMDRRCSSSGCRSRSSSGSVIVLNMLQGSLFGGLRQPVKGLVSALAAAVVGVVLALGYAALMPVVTGDLGRAHPGSTPSSGWPTPARRDLPLPWPWAGDFFGLWPLAGRRPEPVAADDAMRVTADADTAS